MEVTTKIHAIEDEIDEAKKALKSYPGRMSAISKEIKDIRESAKAGNKKVDYDENSNMFVQMYRYFQGTPWENFEKKLQKYDLTLDHIITHLEKNSEGFTSSKDAIEKMENIIAGIKDSVDQNKDETQKLHGETLDAKQEIDQILDEHLQKIHDAKEEYSEAHAAEADTAAAKNAEKRRMEIERRKTNAKNAKDKLEK